MGGSSLSSALGAANLVGDSGGDALGSLIGLMGWSEGGFTGPGGKYHPAGIVHAGEGVLSQEEVRSIGGESGFNFLRRLIKRGYADGGFVGSVLGGNLAPQGGDTNNNQRVEVHNHFAAGTNSQTIDQATQKLAAAIRKSQRNT
jgi:phage-related minor tail protein